MNNKLKPNTPKPTTPIPIMEPPAKAISSAFPIPVRAALVVLTFALVAIRIPMYPAKAEQNAPQIKETATIGDEVSVFAVTPNKMATHTTKIASTRYSALRKPIAPSAMCPAIFFILSVPASCLLIQADFHTVYSNASTPKAGIR
ncbi:MAG: hypothetical protein BWY67_01966 [Bacteroidetes bacterium ADurb.Bin397]|nr:MAG: hypothetical protein BWY67_01966 [Bacteroidetes bacterium ADurb.Bin397]